MPITRTDLENAIKEFKKKILDNNDSYYRWIRMLAEPRGEYLEIREDRDRRRNLYNYIANQINEHDNIESRQLPIEGPMTMATVWDQGTDDQIEAVVALNPDIDIIFNIQSYLNNTVDSRRVLRTSVEEQRKKLEAESNQPEAKKSKKAKKSKTKKESKQPEAKESKKTPKNDEEEAESKQPELRDKNNNIFSGYTYSEMERMIWENTGQLQAESKQPELRGKSETRTIISPDRISDEMEKKKEAKEREEQLQAESKQREKDEKEKEETVKPYKNLTNDRSIEVANELSGLTGIERKSNEPAPEYIDAVTSTANSLTEGVSASMTVAEQKSQLESNYQRILGEAEQKSGDLSMPILIYDLMNTYGVADTIRDITGMILPSLALTASGYRQTVKKKLGEGLSNPIYVSQNLMQRGYNNLAKFFGYDPDDDKKPSEPERKEEPDSYDSQGIRITEEDDAIDFREEPSIPRFTQEESLKAKEDLKNIGAGAAVLGVGVQAIRGDEPIITTKPVTSIIDNRPLTITRERVSSGNIGKRSEGGRRKYSPQIIYPDDEILEPTDNQLSRNEYNLAKFDFINPDNVGGNNSNGDNPLYKANDDELAIRYYDWKNMVIEQENGFVKQLPPKVSDKIKMQFRRSFVEPAEPRQTRLNYMIHDETQFAPFNSPYSEMSENTGTNVFIQNSVLYGSVP
jgi:hypothetical protein